VGFSTSRTYYSHTKHVPYVWPNKNRFKLHGLDIFLQFLIQKAEREVLEGNGVVSDSYIFLFSFDFRFGGTPDEPLVGISMSIENSLGGLG
jgi:hypothetical protein